MALASPFGTLRIPNISPDDRDGIGRWRTADLANALLSGVSREGSHYYPGLPYTSYTHMTLADVRDLMAYLRTLPKVGAAAAARYPFPVHHSPARGFLEAVLLSSRTAAIGSNA